MHFKNSFIQKKIHFMRKRKRRQTHASVYTFFCNSCQIKSSQKSDKSSPSHLRILLLLTLTLSGVLHLLIRLAGSLLRGALVGHLLRGLGGGASLGVGLLLGLLLLALLGGFGLGLRATLVLLRLAALVEALDHGGGGGAQLLVLGDVLRLGGVLAVFVEPVL